MCSVKVRRFMLNQGLGDAEVKDFFKNGMALERFKELFGHDANAQQIIKRVEENGQQKSADNRV